MCGVKKGGWVFLLFRRKYNENPKTIVIFYQEPYHADTFKNCTKKFCIGGLCLVCPTINSFEILLAELLCRALKGVQNAIVYEHQNCPDLVDKL